MLGFLVPLSLSGLSPKIRGERIKLEFVVFNYFILFPILKFGSVLLPPCSQGVPIPSTRDRQGRVKFLRIVSYILTLPSNQPLNASPKYLRLWVYFTQHWLGAG
jgi:hypothetical protein